MSTFLTLNFTQASIFQPEFLESYLKNNDMTEEIASPVEAVLPPLWTSVPTIDSDHFDVDSTGAFMVNAWDYLQRMSLYKFLIENVNHCAWAGEEHATSSEQMYHPGNILWGLPLQHGWQFSSGRLFLDPETSTTININSWWADINYYLSVLPYLAAAEYGIAPRISLLLNPNRQLFCGNVEDCPDDIAPWLEYWKLVNDTGTSCPDHKIGSYPVVNRADFNLSSTMETLLSGLWDAHLHSINVALPKFDAQLGLLSEPEAKFGRSWVRCYLLHLHNFF